MGCGVSVRKTDISSDPSQFSVPLEHMQDNNSFQISNKFVDISKCSTPASGLCFPGIAKFSNIYFLTTIKNSKVWVDAELLDFDIDSSSVVVKFRGSTAYRKVTLSLNSDWTRIVPRNYPFSSDQISSGKELTPKQRDEILSLYINPEAASFTHRIVTSDSVPPLSTSENIVEGESGMGVKKKIINVKSIENGVNGSVAKANATHFSPRRSFSGGSSSLSVDPHGSQASRSRVRHFINVKSTKDEEENLKPSSQPSESNGLSQSVTDSPIFPTNRTVVLESPTYSPGNLSSSEHFVHGVIHAGYSSPQYDGDNLYYSLEEMPSNLTTSGDTSSNLSTKTTRGNPSSSQSPMSPNFTAAEWRYSRHEKSSSPIYEATSMKLKRMSLTKETGIRRQLFPTDVASHAASEGNLNVILNGNGSAGSQGRSKGNPLGDPSKRSPEEIAAAPSSIPVTVTVTRKKRVDQQEHIPAVEDTVDDSDDLDEKDIDSLESSVDSMKRSGSSPLCVLERRRSSHSVVPNNSELAFRMRMSQIGLTIREVIGDGNCLFRAVAHQIFNDENRHAEVRKMCVDHMIEHRDRFEIFCTVKFDEHIRRMSLSGTWGDDLEIKALEEILDRVFYIYCPDCNHNLMPVPMNVNFSESLSLSPSESVDDDTPVKLSYHGSCHYNSVCDVHVKLPLGLKSTRVILKGRLALFHGH